MATRGILGKNIKGFATIKDDLLEEHRGERALMRDGKLVGTYPTDVAARTAARMMFPDGEFAISPEIGAEPESFGSLGMRLHQVEF